MNAKFSLLRDAITADLGTMVARNELDLVSDANRAQVHADEYCCPVLELACNTYINGQLFRLDGAIRMLRK